MSEPIPPELLGAWRLVGLEERALTSCGAGTRTPITSSRGWRLAIRRPRKTAVSLATALAATVAATTGLAAC